MKIAKILIIGIVLLLNISLAYAHEQDFNATKQLIDSEISCNELSEEQLEEIGEYYMEQMHPGESHEIMDKMMGGEDSESLRQMHINMAKRLYCNEEIDGMMGGGMMDMMGNNGMMQSRTTTPYQILFNALFIILLLGLAILVFLGIIRLWKSNGWKNEKRK